MDGEQINNERDGDDNNNNNDGDGDDDDEKIVKFLDSIDSYLTLFDSLSATLRQGWLELASARHSMGTTRISSTLFDLNCHTAATSLKVNIDDSVPTGGITILAASKMKQPSFSLCKWGLYDEPISPEDSKLDEDEWLKGKLMNLQLRHRGTSVILEKDHKSNGSTYTVEDQIQKERSKSLSVFGTLVSPKLRASQLSFESALDTLVEIANLRSVMLSAYNEMQKK